MKPLQARSQNERILAHLTRGKPITTLTAFKRFNVCRLSERIRELRKRGHDISSERVKVRGAIVAKYRLVH